MKRFAGIAIVVLALAGAVSVAGAQELKLDRWDKFTLDDTVQRDGKPSFLWPDIENNTTVKCFNIPVEGAENPQDLSAYNTLKFWMHVQKPVDSVLTMVFRSENPDAEGADYYSVSIPTDFEGWREFSFMLPLIRPTRTPLGWNQIQGLIWSSNWAHKLDPATAVHFQDMALVNEQVPGMDKEPGEVLTNRSFELLQGAGPAGWGIGNYNSEAKVAMDDTVAHTGKRSVRVEGVAKSRGGASCVVKGGDAQPGAKYRMTAWVKADGTSAEKLRTCARLTYVGEDKKIIKTDHFICDAGPFDWKEYTWDFTVPEGTTFYNLVLFHHGEGTAWWDDVSIKKAE